jgi:hypothetical protein
MVRRICVALLVPLWIPCCCWAQVKPSPSQRMPAQRADAPQIKLGQATAPLYGPWRFHTGDSPLDPVTHEPLWAKPDFDDSQWETVDLTPRSGAPDPWSGQTGHVPGWTARGHAGYSGRAWYRIRVHLEARPGEKLALGGPSDLDDSYEVYANGVKLGGSGNSAGGQQPTYGGQLLTFPLPQLPGDNSGSTTQVLAFKVEMQPGTLAYLPDAGGLHAAPVVGVAGAVAAANRMRRQQLVSRFAPTAVEALLFGLLAVLAFGLILFDRSDFVYIWMGSVFLLLSVYYVLVVFGNLTQHLSGLAEALFRDCILTPLISSGWVMMWWVWFGRTQPAKLPRFAALLAILYMISLLLGEPVFSAYVPHPVAVLAGLLSVGVRLLLFVLLGRIVLEGIRQQGLDGWLALPAVLLLGVGMFQGELVALHVPASWSAFGLRVNLDQVADLLVAAALALLLLRRLLLATRRQKLMAMDVKQAQEVQQVMLPEGRVELPGLTIETEYRPAREVGGDFFQVIPRKTDGCLLIVAGDVTGKGLKAGMMVALLVGAIRTAADMRFDPEFVLRELNKRLMGRDEIYATCLAMRISADGDVRVANAGHLPPYLNGEALAMEGALPLGVLERADISVMRFMLREGDRLVLMSDGVLEAMNPEGHLFGFDRVRQLLRMPVSAAAVASAAQSFGQEDDISVISVVRTAIREQALA